MSSAPVELLVEPDRVRLALSPIRRRLLQRLRQPASATELAAESEMSRQRVNYHLRALEAAGLVDLVEERRRRGCTERVLAARADAFVVDPSVLPGSASSLAAAAAQDHYAAEHLIGTAAGVVRDVARMQTDAERAGRRLLTFTIEAEVRFAAPGDLERFTTELAAAVDAVATRFNAPSGGRRYRLVAAGHPAPRAPRRRST
ncbi:MAG: ArsR/SmtB family transcription factor [Acidimicrobiales bacterium]